MPSLHWKVIPGKYIVRANVRDAFGAIAQYSMHFDIELDDGFDIEEILDESLYELDDLAEYNDYTGFASTVASINSILSDLETYTSIMRRVDMFTSLIELSTKFVIWCPQCLLYD